MGSVCKSLIIILAVLAAVVVSISSEVAAARGLLTEKTTTAAATPRNNGQKLGKAASDDSTKTKHLGAAGGRVWYANTGHKSPSHYTPPSGTSFAGKAATASDDSTKTKRAAAKYRGYYEKPPTYPTWP